MPYMSPLPGRVHSKIPAVHGMSTCCAVYLVAEGTIPNQLWTQVPVQDMYKWFTVVFRFCHSCILTWLEDGKTCPDDNSSLGEVTQ